MAVLAWVMMGLAIWHFAVFVPDRFWGGIVGAFVGAIVGAVLVALAIKGFSIPARHETHIATAADAIPGAIIGLGVMYAVGVSRGRRAFGA